MRTWLVMAVSVSLTGFGVSGVEAAAAGTTRPSVNVATSHHAPKVLRVGTYRGIRGRYRTIQAAVNAAAPGDWILVAPGDYKTPHSHTPKGAPLSPAGILITTPDITLRGMNRDGVIVDGTKSGPSCSTHHKDQVLGPKAKNGAHLGRNGIEVWKADNVSIENLTVCNFLGPGSSSGDTGNEIWWNGGADTGKLPPKGKGRGYWGSYMTTTSTYYRGDGTAAQYGIFTSNWIRGTWDVGYASNFNDSGLYIGACQRKCNQLVERVWAEYNALGYSGSNSGGSLVVTHSRFDRNEDGFDTNSQNGDNPPPQNGLCPGNTISPITHTHSCWVFEHNYVHDNNNPNVPTAGFAAAGPVGTGMSLSGGRNDTVMHNRFVRNKAWGNIFVPFPDNGPPCTGGTYSPSACIFDEWGDALLNNKYAHNGGYGNPTNGDFAATNLEAGPTDCYRGNTEIGGGTATMSPSNLESTYPNCNGKSVPPNTNPVFLREAACDSGAISISGASGSSSCLPSDHYPRQTKVVMHPLPGARSAHGRPAIENPASSSLKTMPHVCRGVPRNPWCPDGSKRGARQEGYAGGVKPPKTSGYQSGPYSNEPKARRHSGGTH